MAVTEIASPSPVLLLDHNAVSQLLTLDECIVAVKSAFAAHAAGKALGSAMLHVDAEGGDFHIKVGGLRRERTYLACKVNGGFFENRSRFGLPNIMGLILLCDGSNGVPLALLESGYITRVRTAAATAVAAMYLARKESRTLTICGAGIQAEAQLRALVHILPLKEVFIWSRNDAGDFVRRMSSEVELDVRTVADLMVAAPQSDVIVTCTPAMRWILGRQHVSPGTFIAAVGADSPGKQELEPLLVASSAVVCDLIDQCAHVGELQHAIAAGLMSREDVRGELGAVIAGRVPGRLSDGEVILFDSTGTAMQDVAAAALIYEKALARGSEKSFAFWPI